MNELTLTADTSVALPAMSPYLKSCLRSSYTPTSDGSYMLVHANKPGRNEIAEAKRLLPEYEAALKPAPRSLIRAWMLHIAAAVRNPPTAEQVELHIDLVQLACANFPAAAWNKETLVDALRDERCRFWPAVADVYAIVLATADPLIGKLYGLRRVAALPMPEKRN